MTTVAQKGIISLIKFFYSLGWSMSSEKGACEGAKKPSKKKIIAIVCLCVFVFVLVLAMALLIPREGKKINNPWSADLEFDISKIATVEKKSHQFKIMLITDLQLWSNAADNAKALALVDRLVEKETPDLIVTLGDNISGLTTDILARQFVARMESYKIKWCPIFGNHDAEGNATLSWQADIFEKSEYCLFERGYSNLYGLGNYAINITENGVPVQTLIMFDNGRYTVYEDGTKAEVFMSENQIGWYEWLVKGIESSVGHIVPSMSFAHFALPEIYTAIETLCYENDGFYYVPEGLGYGYYDYLPSVAKINTGYFDKVKELGSTKNIFFGHDHENYASINYQGINLTYGLKTGCSPRYWNNAKIYGATFINLDESNNVSLHNVEEKP